MSSVDGERMGAPLAVVVGNQGSSNSIGSGAGCCYAIGVDNLPHLMRGISANDVPSLSRFYSGVRPIGLPNRQIEDCQGGKYGRGISSMLPGDVQFDSRVRLVDGPYTGARESGFILRGRLECKDGEYLHVLGSDDMELYWVPYPLVVSPGQAP